MTGNILRVSCWENKLGYHCRVGGIQNYEKILGRGGKLRTHRDGPQGGQKRVALSGAQNELDFLAAGLT
jgi:hypothetical protein